MANSSYGFRETCVAPPDQREGGGGRAPTARRALRHSDNYRICGGEEENDLLEIERQKQLREMDDLAGGKPPPLFLRWTREKTNTAPLPIPRSRV